MILVLILSVTRLLYIYKTYKINKTAPQNVYISNFLGKHAPIPPYSFSKKICPPNFSKLAIALILCMTHA